MVIKGKKVFTNLVEKIFNKKNQNIMESLNDFTVVEVLENDNAYFCERCKSKQTAEKCIKFKTYPKILNLQLKR